MKKIYMIILALLITVTGCELMDDASGSKLNLIISGDTPAAHIKQTNQAGKTTEQDLPYLPTAPYYHFEQSEDLFLSFVITKQEDSTTTTIAATLTLDGTQIMTASSTAAREILTVYFSSNSGYIKDKTGATVAAY